MTFPVRETFGTTTLEMVAKSAAEEKTPPVSEMKISAPVISTKESV